MLAVRLVLELTALTAFGLLGWRAFDSPWKYALVVILPVAAAALWGTFAVPDDPSRSGKAPIAVSGRVRLIVEAVVLFGGAAALWAAGLPWWALAFGAILAIYHVIAHDRLRWLITS
ncbi:DUF2568 domain-containing protein [Nocardia cyriacigeorgica]|uniref:DUF2568 domain-containing protein n=2 Tax=Nocardia cyriacigeorgica TaxID=135487 RepID=A0A5R8NYT2_9NOCA|nr:DUF2568 domain-containing protein [Nocardia cyriacigeorgica]